MLALLFTTINNSLGIPNDRLLPITRKLYATFNYEHLNQMSFENFLVTLGLVAVPWTNALKNTMSLRNITICLKVPLILPL